ncbi:MAG: 1-acyl-sn-glycerol-3-phosphate acyltransferase [Bacteroidales bacterium]|nr:1-acyl-sn-glycerol-3-phosphate acyltransferase [Bacteroidales bacterium]
MPKHKYYYWFDERNDDFANTGIKGRPTPEDFEYLPKNVLYRIFKPLVYYLFVTLVVMILVWPVTGIWRLHNVGVLRKRKDRRKGYFVYGNHTTFFADALINPVSCFPRQVYAVVNPDAISIPFASTFLRMLGATPVPCSRQGALRYIDAISRIYEKGSVVAIYPEAHIWPKYNGIRDFSDSSFKMPVRLGAPCYVKSVIYRKTPSGRTRPELWFDGPFYPNSDLPPKEARKELRDRIYAQMRLRCKDSELDERFHYIKVDNPGQVRTETR